MISSKLFVYLVTLLGFFYVVASKRCNGEEKSCIQSKTYSFWSADCYNRSFSKFPQCLNSNLEVIDLSVNRLRKITAEDLDKYSNLKILYLQDNMITSISEDAFDSLDDLQVLDLSINGFTKLPATIFEMQALKKLYLGQNLNSKIDEVINKAVPIKSPLEYLDITYNDLSALPKLGILPTLLGYNISGNNVKNVTLQHFSGLCNLKKLINNDASLQFEEPCNCWTLKEWLRERNVEFGPIECDISNEECKFVIPPQENQIFQECKKRFEQRKFESSMLKVAISILVIALALACTLTCCYFRKCRPRHKLRKTDMPVKIDKHQSEDLL